MCWDQPHSWEFPGPGGGPWAAQSTWAGNRTSIHVPGRATLLWAVGQKPRTMTPTCMATDQRTRGANKPGAHLAWGASQSLAPAGEAVLVRQPRAPQPPRASLCLSCASVVSYKPPYLYLRMALETGFHPGLQIKPVALSQERFRPARDTGQCLEIFWVVKTGGGGWLLGGGPPLAGNTT